MAALTVDQADEIGVTDPDADAAVLNFDETLSPTITIGGDYGRDEVDFYPSHESWVSWLAPTTTNTIFNLNSTSSDSYTVQLYAADQTTLLDTVSGSGPLTLEIPATAGSTYWLKFTSAGSAATFYFSYNSVPEPVNAADPYDSFVVEVYEPDGVTLITELPRRLGLTFQEPLNEVGMGQVTVLRTDPIFEAYPYLFDWKNIVKFWLGDKCVHGFRIKRKSTVLVTGGEWAEWRLTVSGPSVQHILNDFIVRHDNLMNDRSSEERNFGWMAWNGEWHDPSLWNGPYNVNSQLDPPGPVGVAAKDRPKYHKPDQWPDPTSEWIWVSYNPDRNEDNFDPPPMQGKRYYRKQFTVATKCIARLYATSDEDYKVYVDGELVLENDGKEVGYEQHQHVKLILREGTHLIAVYHRSRGQVIADGADAFMCSIMKLNAKGKPTSVIMNSGRGWNTTYQRPVPTWNKAEVLRAVVREAKDRGNFSANMTTFGFTKDVDSAGEAWTDRYNEVIPIGTKGLEVQAMLSEGGGFDVWVDPEDFQIKAWRRRGTDKSASVTLEPGRNIMEWTVDEEEDVENDFLIHYKGGWTRYVAHGSQETYGEREAFVTLGRARNEEDAQRVIKKASDGVAWAIERAGTADLVKRKEIDPQGGIIAVDGARPFLDFGVGDTIKAPNKMGILVPSRVLMLTATEDEQGQVVYDPETEEVV